MSSQPDFIPSYLIDRQEVENAIESLLNLLDKMEVDPDLEPSLSGFQPNNIGDDREQDDCDMEYTGDDEPYLSTGAAIWSTSGGQGSECDYELNEGYNAKPMVAGQAK